ncbi:MAG: outer membrane beta-barrel protein, partial [Verrucomicrobiae bacterium]|nr:outer membrane beta-barrel protein [Verrucomicrobiae bacterium]
PGQRQVRRDGDVSDIEPQQPLDGIVEVGEPRAAVDGNDPAADDTRAIEEARLFDIPTPPGDGLLFQIEELDPILDRRPQRLYRFEPFDPVGIRTGSFVLFPELETSGAFVSNVFRSPGARSDVALDVRPSARLVSNWSRHALEFRANGTLTYFNDFPSEDDRAYTIESRGRLDISRRTNVQIGLSRSLSQESRSAPDGRNAGTRADLTTDQAIASLNHRFNRLSLNLRGSVSDLDVGTTENQGVIQDNTNRNYSTTEQAVRATWEFKPTLSAFGEVGLNQRDYGRRDANGIDRSSDGERFRVGLSFAGVERAPGERGAGPLWAGEVSAGWGQQRPRSSILPDVSGVILDSTVTWRPSAMTAVAFNARSDFGESQDAGVGGIKSQSIGIDVRQELRRYLIGTAGADLTFSDFEGSTIEETELRLTAGLEYFLSRDAIVFGRYGHINFESNQPSTSYAADEVRVGMRIRR